MERRRQLLQQAQSLGIHAAAIISVKDIAFRRDFRDACVQNACGKYGACWMCPPDIGDIDEMICRAKTFQHGFFFQTVGQLEDSFDIEGMQDAAKRQNDLAQALWEQVEPILGTCIRLGAGGCHRCERCARVDNLPCRHPQLALASLEAYGIAVSELASLCGMDYINGVNTVTYFGGFLYN